MGPYPEWMQQAADRRQWKLWEGEFVDAAAAAAAAAYYTRSIDLRFFIDRRYDDSVYFLYGGGKVLPSWVPFFGGIFPCNFPEPRRARDQRMLDARLPEASLSICCARVPVNGGAAGTECARREGHLPWVSGEGLPP